MSDLKAPSQANDSRKEHVGRDVIEKVLAACPDSEWRLIVALARYAGLRVPTEIYALKWGDVDWVRGGLTVRASKTEHCSDGGVRQVPIDAVLLPFLQAVHDERVESQRFAPLAQSEYVITEHRTASGNLRTDLLRFIERAGVQPWQKLFVNLRASCQNDWESVGVPPFTVDKWLGHTSDVADKHYRMASDSAWRDVVNGTAKPMGGEKTTVKTTVAPSPTSVNSAANGGGEQTQETQKPRKTGAFYRVAFDLENNLKVVSVPPRGVESDSVTSFVSSSWENCQTASDSNSASFNDDLGEITPVESVLVEHWGTLPQTVRDAILSSARSADNQSSNG